LTSAGRVRKILPVEHPDSLGEEPPAKAGVVDSAKLRWTVLVALAVALLPGCPVTSTRQPRDRGPVSFEEGIRDLARDLGGQLDRSSVSNLLNKVVLNPLNQQKVYRRIVVDPFVDVESGYPVKASTRIVRIVSDELEQRFPVAGQLAPDTLDVAEYVLNGTVTIVSAERKGAKRGYKVRSNVFEKATGKVLASASVVVGDFDTTPLDIYRDSPVFIKSRDYEERTSSATKRPGETVDPGYRDRLELNAVVAKGDALYEQQEYAKSLSYYNQAAAAQSAPSLEVLNGQFTNYLKQGMWDDAAAAYGRLIRASIAETSQVASKITFAPNAVLPLESKAVQYNLYIKEIASLVVDLPSCRVRIVGHSSRTGSEAYNDSLSLKRAEWIRNQMAIFAPGIADRAETVGRGFRENIVGTGRDDVTDEIDRRVEFVFTGCVR
jgi:outer membrane protein OmpA-like peptidoglycan-associated protein